jgi:acyl carrier protein
MKSNQKPEDMETKERVIQIVADVLGLDKSGITEDFSYLDTDRWDSLKHMEIVTAIEQNFSVALTVHDITAMVGVSDIVNILDQKNLKKRP